MKAQGQDGVLSQDESMVSVGAKSCREKLMMGNAEKLCEMI